MSAVEQMAGVLRVLPEASALVAGGGRILAVNDLARNALGIGSNSGDVALAELLLHAEEFRRYLRLCARSLDPVPGAFSVQRRASAPVDYQCKGSLVQVKTDAEPSIILLRFWQREDDGNVFILLNQKLAELTHEVTRRREVEGALRRSEAALRERATEAETLNRTKDEFLATLSHELRTPLNAILGWVRLLRQGQLSTERQARALETIERNARAQSQLIEELLDLSSIITGKVRLRVQQIDPITVVEAAIDAIRPAADAKGIRLQPVLDPQAGPIMGDPERLQQVCWNLLSNAVKFTPKGGRVQVLLERVESSVELSVIDTGRGIRPEFLPLVFDRFRQQEGGTDHSFGGLGLGLSIVKSLVELHGGSVRVHSDGDDRGATFVTQLPRSLVRIEGGPQRPFAAVTFHAHERFQCPPELDGLRILIVDDETAALDLMLIILEQSGALVKTARSAGEAVETLQSFRPDVLISDIGMPGENGYSLIRKVRALGSAAGGKTPAVALTAFARAEDRTQALNAGFQTHVSKPVDVTELLAVVASLVRRGQDAL